MSLSYFIKWDFAQPVAEERMNFNVTILTDPFVPKPFAAYAIPAAYQHSLDSIDDVLYIRTLANKIDDLFSSA